MLKWSINRKSTPGKTTDSSGVRVSQKRCASELIHTPKRKRMRPSNFGPIPESKTHLNKENRQPLSQIFSPSLPGQNPLRDLSNLHTQNCVTLKKYQHTLNNPSSLKSCDYLHRKDSKCNCSINLWCSTKTVKCNCNEWLKKEGKGAPTLPTLAAEDSPCISKRLEVETFGKQFLFTKSLLEKSIDKNSDKTKFHFNGSGQSIGALKEIENIDGIVQDNTETTNESLANRINEVLTSNRSSEFSPLAQRLNSLKFNKSEIQNVSNSSSVLDDLSLDDIVNAVLDASSKSDVSDKNVKPINIVGNTEVENNIKQNLVNQEIQFMSSSVKSSDSGFSGTFDKQLHEVDNNFNCKCRSSSKVLQKSKKRRSSRNKLTSSEIRRSQKKISQLNYSFNERSVDVVDDKNLLENSTNDSTFTLKRQKCIRRRKTLGTLDLKKMTRKTFGESSTDRLENVFEKSAAVEEKPSEKENADEKLLQTLEKKSRRCLDFFSPSFNDVFCNAGGSSTPKRNSEEDNCQLVEIDSFYKDGSLYLKVSKSNTSEAIQKDDDFLQLKVVLKTLVGESSEENNASFQTTWLRKKVYSLILNQTLKIPIDDEFQKNTIHLSFWLNNSQTRNNQFLGSSSYSIKDVIETGATNCSSFFTLPRFVAIKEDVENRTENFISSSASLLVSKENRTMNTSLSTNEEIVSLDDLDDITKTSVSKDVLSEQQKEADENVFLRYLELDPMEGPDAIPAATQRKATGNKSGRTPFTSTKILTKIPKTGFGFSVVWTHPPRVERIEKGSPAEKSGMVPGDYIIFVDKHNVVMMPEIDILNLIRSCGNQLTLEIFRRNPSKNDSAPLACQPSKISDSSTKLLMSSSALTYHRSSTVGSTHTTNPASIDCNRKKLHLPQVVTFSSEKTITDTEESRRKILFQIMSKEQTYVTELQFGTNRFLFPLAERKDILNPFEHKILFQNIEEILKISEEIIENIVQEDGEQSIQNVAYSFFRKLGEITTAYRKYCSGIKKADCVLADRTKNSNSGFVRFLQTPLIPRKRPDITAFIHKPLQHYRDILNLFSIALGYSNSKQEDYNYLVKIVKEMQLTYRTITKEAGFMEPGGKGRLLLSVQDLENRLVFTKCKPFVLSKPGRHWIFGGELFRVEGRNIRQYWTLLFSDILLFAKVSRDRVLFITEEPLPLSHITDIIFTVRKKSTEFRLLVQPGGVNAKSPTVHCGIDITKAPKKQAGKRCIVLRAPNIESKAIWQNLLQRQTFRVNFGMENSTLSSPLESPEAPCNFSAVILQSTESLSNRRQNARYSNQSEQCDSQKKLNEFIELKCKQMGKTGDRGKGVALHLENWMKSQFTSTSITTSDDEPINEIWSEEQLRRRTQELLSGDCGSRVVERNESRCEKMEFSDASPSKSTSLESQVTVKSSPVDQGSVKICKQCQKTCLNNSNNNINNNYLNNTTGCHYRNHTNVLNDCKNFNISNDGIQKRQTEKIVNENQKNYNYDNCNFKNECDPFLPIPRININPPTPDMRRKDHKIENTFNGDVRNNHCSSVGNNSLIENNESEDDENDDDESQENFSLNDEQPYHSLSTSNPNLRRYGTLSSLKQLGSQESDNLDNSDSDDSDDERLNRGFNNTSTIKSWTLRAGAYVTEKIAFFERLGEDYKTGAGFFERYLKTIQANEEECENSAATSGEELWGTPTSGGDLEDPSVYSNCEGQRSLSLDSGSSENEDDAELMMDELLMTPPMATVNIRGLLPRTTLEPLIEEETDTFTSSSSSSSSIEARISNSKKGKETGVVADAYYTVAKEPQAPRAANEDGQEKNMRPCDLRTSPLMEEANPIDCSLASSEMKPRIHRSESYRNIIEAEDEGNGFFRRLNPNTIKIENFSKCRSIRLLDILNVRRGERKIYETFPTEADVLKLFSKEGSTSQDVPTSYGKETPFSPKKLKDKPSDRRFWKQLSRRKSNKSVESGT